jgi:hypothetical protein
MKVERIAIGLSLALAVIAIFPTAVIAQAQEDYWTLTVWLHPAFGTSHVYVEAYGPFGDTVGYWFPTGIGAYATLQLPYSEFPAGYYYKIGIGTGILGSILPSWFTETSTGQNQVFTYDGNSLY